MTLSRLAAAFGLVFLFAANAAAQNVSVSIVEHGLYTAEVTATERMPNGVDRNLLRNICHVVTTDKVPARMNVMFGFRFRTDGTPSGEVVELTRITRFPVTLTPTT